MGSHGRPRSHSRRGADGAGPDTGSELHSRCSPRRGWRGASPRCAHGFCGARQRARARLIELLAPLVAQPDAPTALPAQVHRLQAHIGTAPEAPVALEAAAAGFADQGHMTRHFGHAFGLTPGALAAAQRLS